MNVEAALGQLDLLPLEVAHLGGPQAMAVGHQDHGRVAMPIAAVLARAVHQPLDLALGEIASLDCQVYDAWCAFPGCRFHADKPCLRVADCLAYTHFLHSQVERRLCFMVGGETRHPTSALDECIRLTRQDVIELYGHVSSGALAPR